jgi:hypothetical protein
VLLLTAAKAKAIGGRRALQGLAAAAGAAESADDEWLHLGRLYRALGEQDVLIGVCRRLVCRRFGPILRLSENRKKKKDELNQAVMFSSSI